VVFQQFSVYKLYVVPAGRKEDPSGIGWMYKWRNRVELYNRNARNLIRHEEKNERVLTLMGCDG
jgi:hypothetical protein